MLDLPNPDKKIGVHIGRYFGQAIITHKRTQVIVSNLFLQTLKISNYPITNYDRTNKLF